MQKKKEEEAARDKELNELFKVAISQPKVPVGMLAVALNPLFCFLFHFLSVLVLALAVFVFTSEIKEWRPKAGTFKRCVYFLSSTNWSG